MKTHKTLTLSCLAMLFLGLWMSCGTKKTIKGKKSVLAGQKVIDIQNAPEGLAMELSDGQESFGTRPSQKNKTKSEKLSDKEALALLNRLAPIQKNKNDKQEFALREGSKPPPRTGNTNEQVFPPAVDKALPKRASEASLRVLRFAPEGNVPIAPHVSITFNKPMVDLTSQKDVATSVPAKLTPSVPGKWRWLGTKTLLFDPDVRLPMATHFSVSIPSNTKSNDGTTLNKALSFQFSTSPLTMVESIPGSGPQPLIPAIGIRFDQRINPNEIIKTIHLKEGSEKFRVRLATDDEIESDAKAKAFVKRATEAKQQDWIVVFRPIVKLPKDKKITVVLEKGSPSAEGSRKTEIDHDFSFQTHGPFKVTKVKCSWGGPNDCKPGAPWSIETSNPLDEQTFTADGFDISPLYSGHRISAQNNRLTIQGPSKARTDYTINVPSTLVDVFGQTIEGDLSHSIKTGDADPSLQGPHHHVVLDPHASKPTFDIHSVNVKKLDVKIYKVTPKDWNCLLYTSPSPRDATLSRMPSSA